MFGKIDVLSGTYRGSGGGRDGHVPGLERMGEVWVVERNLRENDFFARLLFFTSSCMHMLGKLRPVILECFYSFVVSRLDLPDPSDGSVIFLYFLTRWMSIFYSPSFILCWWRLIPHSVPPQNPRTLPFPYAQRPTPNSYLSLITFPGRKIAPGRIWLIDFRIRTVEALRAKSFSSWRDPWNLKS